MGASRQPHRVVGVGVGIGGAVVDPVGYFDGGPAAGERAVEKLVGWTGGRERV